MQPYQFIQWSAALTGLAFMVAFGCICGSFINVLVYRLPRGENVVTPPSACPACGTRLTWRENFPVLGWLWLGGRCRFCLSPISPQYPLVELCVGLLFGSIYALWFMDPSVFSLLGVSVAYWRPEWAGEGLVRMWPMLIVVLAVAGSLVAGTLIDARTFNIPLSIPWFATGVAVVSHPLHALWLQVAHGGLRSSTGAWNDSWAIAVPSGPWLGGTLGASVGLGLSIILLRSGILPQSFADYEEWERSLPPEPQPASLDTPSTPGHAARHNDRPVPLKVQLTRTLFLTGPAIALMFLGFTLGLPAGRPLQWTAIGMAVGLLVGLALRRLVPRPGDGGDDPVWLQYPRARREIAKELLFLAPVMGLGLLGWWLTSSNGPWATWGLSGPLWLKGLSGSLLGYLVGGGIVWVFRIGGSLVLGKEAMGLGDVHLLAAAGAALGWPDPLLAFFTAPFLGIAWAVLSVFFGRVFHRQGTALPYGPHLATAVLLVMLFKPLYELGLATLLGRPVNIP